MIRMVLRALAEENFDDQLYPVLHEASTCQPFALMVKKQRAFYLRPFTKSEFIIIAGLDKYVTGDKKEEFLKAVNSKKGKQDNLLIADYDEEDEQAKNYTEVGLKAVNCVEGNIKISYDLGELQLGKLDEEYFDHTDLVDILQETELDTQKMRLLENEDLRLIYSVIYSERFLLKGSRRHELSVDGDADVPVLMIPQLKAKAKAHAKKKIIPKAPMRNTRGPVYFRCVRVKYDKENGRLKIPESAKKKIHGHLIGGAREDIECSKTTLAFEDEEDDLPVPPEILARGASALRAYTNALNEGTICVKRVPVMVVGQERTGKTSLKKSLMGQVYNPNEDSTVGIDVDPSYFKVSAEIWKPGETDQENVAISYEHHAAHLIAASLMEEKETVAGNSSASRENKEPTKRAMEPVQSGDRLMANEDLSDSSPNNVSSHDSKPSDVDRDESDDEEASEEELPEEIATLVEKMLQKAKMEEDDEDVYAVLWDFGGQSVYYVTHPLFLTSKAIYLLVYDLSKSAHDKANPLVKQGMFKKIEDNYSLKTNLDYLDCWMTSVASLSSQSEQQPASSNSVFTPKELPPVFLVCTHADDPYGGEDSRALANEIFDFLQNKPYGAHLFEKVFVVDNTKSGGDSECPGVLSLRQNVLALANELPQVKEAIPIKWMQYEKALQVMKEDGNHSISLEKAKEIASKVCKIDDDEEILTLLNFLHDQRILIHFDDTPELNKLVVLDAQWLIDVFKKVITVKPCDHEEREFKDLWRNLERKGILDEKLLEHVWDALLDQEETSDSLIAIMEKFSLMCPWPSSDTSCGKQYLVPSMLMSHPPQGIVQLLESALIPSLFLKFQSFQIPPSLFPRLVLQFFQWCTKEFPTGADPQFHHNFARFYISGTGDPGCSVVLLCHSSSLEVVILSENHTTDLDEGFKSKVSFSANQSQCTLDVIVARAVRQQLVSLLESMKREFFWLNNFRYEVSFLCPACSKGGTVNYCQIHRAEGCKQQECLHFWSESELFNVPQVAICRKSADSVKTTVLVKQFAPWFILPNEKITTLEGDGSHLTSVEEKSFALPCAVQDALLSQSCFPKDVLDTLLGELQLEQASLKNPEPETKRMIRCLARKAKCSNRLDVVEHLRKVTPAGTLGPLLDENLDVLNIPSQQKRKLLVNLCGGDEWMLVAERLGLKAAEIRYLDKRSNNLFEDAIMDSPKGRTLNVGQLYDVLVDCGFPTFADLL